MKGKMPAKKEMPKDMGKDHKPMMPDMHKEMAKKGGKK